MFDLSQQKVTLNCPSCKRALQATIKQITNQAIVRCSCGQEIQLKDNNGSSRKAVNDVNKAFNDLDKMFKNFGK